MNMRHLFCILSLIPTLLYGDTWVKSLPNGFSIKVLIPETSINLDETLTIELEAAFPKDYVLDTAGLIKHLINDPGFGPLPFYMIDTTQTETDQSLHITYTLEPNLIGNFLLSFMNIMFVNKIDKDKKVEIVSDVFKIDIKEGPKAIISANMTAPVFLLPFEYPLELSTVNKEHFKEQKKEWIVKNEQLFQSRLFPWKSLLFILGLIGVSFLALTRKKTEPSKELLAQAKALKALNKLRSAKHTEDSYINLVQIVRVYIEERYGLNAPTLTTEEFLPLALESPFFDDNTQNLLKNFLQQADKVKFAQHTLSPEEWNQALNAAEEFVKP